MRRIDESTRDWRGVVISSLKSKKLLLTLLREILAGDSQRGIDNGICSNVYRKLRKLKSEFTISRELFEDTDDLLSSLTACYNYSGIASYVLLVENAGLHPAEQFHTVKQLDVRNSIAPDWVMDYRAQRWQYLIDLILILEGLLDDE